VATVNTTLAIPGVLVIAVVLGLWQLIVRGVVQLPSQIVEGASGAENRGALWPEHSGRSVLGSLVLLLAALFAVWLLLPAVTAERNPPQTPNDWVDICHVDFVACPRPVTAAKSPAPERRSSIYPLPEVCAAASLSDSYQAFRPKAGKSFQNSEAVQIHQFSYAVSSGIFGYPSTVLGRIPCEPSQPWSSTSFAMQQPHILNR
jgi:hypothetical protein